MVKGSYAMVIHVRNNLPVTIGGTPIELRKGYYLYIGSALNGIKRRLKWHFRKGKKIHWHVDNLTENGKIVDVYYVICNRKIECEIAERISLQKIRGFGDTDCKCGGHLFYSPDMESIIKEIQNVMSIFGEVKIYEAEH